MLLGMKRGTVFLEEHQILREENAEHEIYEYTIGADSDILGMSSSG